MNSDTLKTELAKTAQFFIDTDREMQQYTDLDEMYIMLEAMRRLNMRDSNGKPVPMAIRKESDNDN